MTFERFSWRRRKFNPGSGEKMQRYGLVRTSAEWTAINGLTALHRRLGPRYALLRYTRILPQIRRRAFAPCSSWSTSAAGRRSERAPW